MSDDESPAEHDENMSSYPDAIFAPVNGERPIIPNHVYPVMKTLIERCWSPDPDNRPSFNDILESIELNDFRIIPKADATTIRDLKPVSK
jgi:hypothetical protein